MLGVAFSVMSRRNGQRRKPSKIRKIRYVEVDIRFFVFVAFVRKRDASLWILDFKELDSGIQWLGFWISKTWILNSKDLETRLQGPGFWVPTTWVLGSNDLDSGFQRLWVPRTRIFGFQIPDFSKSWIKDSKNLDFGFNADHCYKFRTLK